MLGHACAFSQPSRKLSLPFSRMVTNAIKLLIGLDALLPSVTPFFETFPVIRRVERHQNVIEPAASVLISSLPRLSIESDVTSVENAGRSLNFDSLLRLPFVANLELQDNCFDEKECT